MKTYLIFYRLQNPIEDVSKVEMHLRTYSKWAHPFPDAWIVGSEDKITDVRSNVSSVVSNKINLMVIDISGRDWATYDVSSEITDWMKQNI